MLWISKRLCVLVLGSLFLLAVGCKSVVPVTTPTTDDSSPTAPLTQRLFIVVHGDASYLYHDREGTVHEADVETLQEAFASAQALPGAEVFIFHQRSHDPLFGVFTRDDGTFYHFRQGKLQHQTTYRQNRSVPLKAEAALVRSHQAPVPDSSLFTAALYYGHAVPERPRSGYHRSRTEAKFGMNALVGGLDRLHPSGPFDAVVLSTCNGGTPQSVVAVAPYTHALLASPGDLHLSFIDADLLATLSPALTPDAWTRQFAERAFDRLRDRVTTAVTLVTYDLDEAGPTARRMAQTVAPDTSTTPTGARHVDCRQVVDLPVDTTGVEVWHRPARFGPQADRDSHSGWGCTQASARDGARPSRSDSDGKTP